MKARIVDLALLVLLPLAGILVANQGAASPQDPDASQAKDLALVQSELDFLKARDLPVTLNFKEVRPSKIFEAVKEAAVIEIQYRGQFSDDVRVTIALDKVTLKTALKELARQLDIYYRVPAADKLVIIVAVDSSPAPITALTGEPELIEHVYTPSRAYTRTEYEEAVRYGAPEALGPIVEVHKWPHDLSPQARYGIITLGGKSFTYIIDRVSSNEHVLRIDLNADGDLQNDPARPMTPGQPLSPREGMFVTVVDATRNYAEASLRVKCMLAFEPDRDLVRVYDWTLREGQIMLGERKVAFALSGRGGVYNEPQCVVHFDTDGDGRLELATVTRRSDDAYRIFERFVNLEDVTYEFIVSRHGESLTLKPLSERMPDRLRLAPGNLAPDFVFVDIDGFAGRLSDYRGKYLLLYFWGTWCGPCIKETPKLVDAYASFKQFGFEILGIDEGDTIDVLRVYLNNHGVSWRQILQDDDVPIDKQYRVNIHPTYVLIDPDGIIIRTNMRAKDLEAQLNEVLRPTSPVD